MWASFCCIWSVNEYEIEAELLHEFLSKGAQTPPYPVIVAGGANACVLHYISKHKGHPLCFADGVTKNKVGVLLISPSGCPFDYRCQQG